MSKTTAYKKTKTGTCPTVCSIQFGGNVTFNDTEGVNIENNCGGGGGGEDSGIGSDNVVDCQMDKWSECSQTCKEGTQTRKKITGPFNGGAPCGPTSQTCNIPCTSLKKQLENKYFNFNKLDNNNKIIFIAVVCIIIFIIFNSS